MSYDYSAWKRGKAPEYLLSIADATKDLHIKMAGKWIDPQYREEFKSLLAASGHQKQIEVLGEVSEEQMAELYAKALFVLQTNDDRGFGLPALEAAGRGTAFIIPEGQGVCALFTDGVEGFYTREKDTAKIVAYIQELTQNPGKAAEMGKRGLSKVKTNYTWQNHAAQLIEVAQGGQQ
jgi:glycosyltransferase involved in cell wall biosynthesis